MLPVSFILLLVAGVSLARDMDVNETMVEYAMKLSNDVREDQAGNFVGSIFTCLIAGFCSPPAPSIECGLQGNRGRTFQNNMTAYYGQGGKRIVGGTVAAPAEFPWAAALSLSMRS